MLTSGNKDREIKLNSKDEKAYQVLSKIVNGINAGAEVSMTYTNQDYTIFEISKADPGIIIGKHGHTLDAIQYLLNLVVNKEKDHQSNKIYLVDINGYRKRREETFKKYAKEKAEIAKRKGCTVALYYMNSIERKLVHMALKEDPEVITYSEGREPYRRVIIKPTSQTEAGVNKKDEY
ncbi:MAG: KH domain-containing protein [Candidatus Atribacteria bacterium]|nr:KH domain-containing protein [Candidatus Atribacteria bacterium]